MNGMRPYVPDHREQFRRDLALNIHIPIVRVRAMRILIDISGSGGVAKIYAAQIVRKGPLRQRICGTTCVQSKGERKRVRIPDCVHVWQRQNIEHPEPAADRCFSQTRSGPARSQPADQNLARSDWSSTLSEPAWWCWYRNLVEHRTHSGLRWATSQHLVAQTQVQREVRSRAPVILDVSPKQAVPAAFFFTDLRGEQKSPKPVDS